MIRQEIKQKGRLTWGRVEIASKATDCFFGKPIMVGLRMNMVHFFSVDGQDICILFPKEVLCRYLLNQILYLRTWREGSGVKRTNIILLPMTQVRFSTAMWGDHCM